MHSTARAHDSWRARIGFVTPASNTAFEAWLPRIVPDGVSFHTSRMRLPRGMSIPDALVEMEKHEKASIDLVMDCEPDVLMFACTASSIVKGYQGDLDLIAKLEAQTGIPCTTITEGIVKAFKDMGVNRICIGSPYPPELDEMEHRFFTQAGLEVVNVHGMGFSDPADMCDVAPGEIYRFARSIWDQRADALLLTCGAFRAQHVVTALEEDLGVPVVTSITATLWASLRLAGVMAPIQGYGRLLSEPGRPYRQS